MNAVIEKLLRQAQVPRERVGDEVLIGLIELTLHEAYEVVTRAPNIGTSLAGQRMLDHFGVKRV